MTQTTKPSKEKVRKIMDRHVKEKSPPLTPEEFRRELGWELIPGNGTAPEVKSSESL